MHPMSAPSPFRRSLCALLVAALLAGPLPLRGASTGQTALHTPQGGGTATANGEYVSTTLNTYYRYFIEVPPGLGRLTVEVFDPDIGRGGNADADNGRDRDRGGYDSAVTYTLIRPDGSTAATLANCDDNTCNDNTWTAVLNSTTAQNTAAGHWELRADLSGSAGDDINAIGVRAHDGTSGSGGTELPVYLDSIVAVGVNPPDSGTVSRAYTLYPYVTSGCTASTNDFDYDSNSGNVGSIVYSSRTNAFTQTFASAALSGDNAWNRDTINRWTSDQLATEYGIWKAAITISSYLVNNTPNGNYTDIYVGNFQVSATVAPSANPQPNSFRLYLPTDAGTAPVKPYLEQLLTFKSGTNPPPVGQTARYQVTVRLVNPTTRPIVFSAANLVTANVPGGGAVYAGNAAVGQGSIVAQPAVGGTGNITWNPGTVAAGATTILTYQVNVTPTSSGQRIAVTGTPASNGTRATYVDETGNTTQGRATFTFGPLCELAMTQNQLTQAVVSAFHASPADGGGVLLEWKTASEAGTTGFYVQRWDAAARRWTRASRSLLAGSQAPQGGVYRFVDEGVSAADRDGPLLYRLEEVEAAGGRHRTYGPFAAAVDWSRPDPRQGSAAYERAARPAPGRGDAAPPDRLPAREDEALAAGAKAAAARDGVRLAVRQTGLYYLRAADVQAWLDLPADKVGKQIAKGKLALTRGDQPVAWYPDLAAAATTAAGAKAKQPEKDTAQGLFFYGEAPGPDDLYTDAGIYRLKKDEDGLLMQTVAAAAPAPASVVGSFPESLHAERNAFAATVLPLAPESDYWFWDFLQGSDPTYGHRAYTLDAPGFAGAGGGALAVSLQGATASGVADEHRLQVALNGTPLGETRWTGITAQRATFTVPPGLLRETGNQVDLTAQTGDGAPYSIFYLDSFDLSYAGALRAAGDALAFTPGGSPRVTVAGFSGPDVRLLDVQDPLRPRWITGAAVAPDGGAGFQASFAPPAQGKYFAAGPAALAAPAAVRPWSPPGLRSAGNRAQYLVIAPAGLHAAAERLADLRRAQGLEAMVVDLDAVMDEFNAGVPNPHAIRDFLAYARTGWSLAPRYVALAGAGTLDYRNLLGFGDSLVPPLIIQSDGGLYPSDNLLGDVDGDGLPEMAVGRIPVLSAAELDAYTAKLAAYEGAAAADWTGAAVMAADAPDRGADFTADSNQVAAQLSPLYAVSHVDLGAMALADARAQLLGAINQGTAFVNYMGHGALDRLSSGGLMTSADVPGLTNGGRLPVVTAMTCAINRFAVPGFPSLGELLAKSPGGGAAAVWGPAGLSASGEARLLAERFYHSADDRLGDRVLRAIAEYQALGGAMTLPPVYDLLGDPALRLKVPPPRPVTGGSTTE